MQPAGGIHAFQQLKKRILLVLIVGSLCLTLSVLRGYHRGAIKVKLMPLTVLPFTASAEAGWEQEREKFNELAKQVK